LGIKSQQRNKLNYFFKIIKEGFLVKKFFLLFLVLVFVLTMAIPASAADLKEGLTVSLYKVLDNQNVVVKFKITPGGSPYWGATDVPIYKVTNAAGEVQEMTSVPSYFLEGGGDVNVLDTFKMVFKNPLAPGTYTVTVEGMQDSLTAPILYFAPCTTTFTIEGTAETTAATTAAEGTTTGTTSPSTGDAGMIGYAIMALGGLSGMMLLRKRSK
jgi:LPXTG-motif cell wall-anchored protein